MNPNPIEPTDQVPAPELTPTPRAQEIVPLAAGISRSFAQVETPAPTPVAPPPTSVPVTPAPDVLFPATPSNLFTAGEPIVDPATNNPSPIIGSGAVVGEKPARKKLNRTVLISIVIGTVLLAIAGAILYFMFTNVTKEDYMTASTQYEAVVEADAESDTEMRNFYFAIALGNTTYDTRIDDTQKLITTTKDENTKLSKLKAVQSGEAEKLYAVYNDLLVNKLNYSATLVDSYKEFTSVAKQCDVLWRGFSSGFATSLAACSDKLKTLNELPNDDYQTYITTISDEYAKYAVAYAALKNPTGNEATLAEPSMAISKATTDLTESIEKNNDVEGLKKAGEALNTYLTEHSK